MLPPKHALTASPTATEVMTQHEWKVFHERDMRELGVGLGNVIAMAEQMIVNDNSFEHVKAKVKESFEKD